MMTRWEQQPETRRLAEEYVRTRAFQLTWLLTTHE